MNGQTFLLNGEAKPWREATLAELMSETGLDFGRGGIAVARNGAVVPRTLWGETRVEPDDKIEIVHIVRGG